MHTENLAEPSEFTFRTEDSKFFDIVLEGHAMRESWISALPPPPSHTMLGWVHERYEGALQSGKRSRYAIYDMGTASFGKPRAIPTRTTLAPHPRAPTRQFEGSHRCSVLPPLLRAATAAPCSHRCSVQPPLLRAATAAPCSHRGSARC